MESAFSRTNPDQTLRVLERDLAWARVREQVHEAVAGMKRHEDIARVLGVLESGLRDTGLQFGRMSLQIIDVERDLYLNVSNDRSGARSLSAVRDWLETTPVWRAWTTGLPEYRPDLDALDRFGERTSPPEWRVNRARSVVDVPFSHGTLAVNSLEPNAFSDESIRCLQQTARALSSAYARVVDLMALEESRQALKDREELYRSVIEAAGAVAYERDWQQGRYTFMGEGILELTGYGADEITPALYEQLVVEERRLEAPPVGSRPSWVGTDAPHRIYRADCRLRRRDGSFVWVSDSALQKYDEDGQLMVTLGMLIDVTARVTTEEDLARSRSRYRSLLFSVPDTVLEIDSEHRIVFASKALAGYEVPDLLGRRLTEVVTAPDWPRVEALLAAHGRGEAPFGEEVALLGPQGVTYWMVRVASPHGDEKGPLRMVVATDITQVRRAQKERERLEEHVRHVQKLDSLGVLAGGIAHDFNNLLMGVLGNASLALTLLPPESPARERVRQIETAAARAAELSNQMLAYSGKGKFVVEQVNLSSLVEEMTHLLLSSISKKAELSLDLAPDLPPITGDPTQLRQVVMNLITNASDALGNEPGCITVTKELRSLSENELADCLRGERCPAGPHVCLEVRDTGCGMEPDVLERVFDPFFTTKPAGRGLGMAVVLGIVRGHNGALQVQSKPGEGTVFRVMVPSEKPETPAPDGGTEPEEAPVASNDGRQICELVVDDESVVRDVACAILESAGYATEQAEDGVAAVDLFRANPTKYGAILLDMTMPRLGGVETLAELRLIRPGVPVLLSSGFSHGEEGEPLMKGPHLGFIQKPYRASALIKEIEALLRQSE